MNLLKLALAIGLSTAAVAGIAQAAPTLVATPYAVADAPDAASFTINGGAPISCALPNTSVGVTPTCNLGTITAPGVYTLVMTVSRAAACTNTTNAASCGTAGTASSPPFAYTLRNGSVSAPALKIQP